MRRLALCFVFVFAFSLPALDAGFAASPVKKGPGYRMKTHTKKKSKGDITEASIKANIDNQKMILELEDKAGAAYPQMLVALADFYWDLSEVFDRRATDKLEDQIFDATEANQVELVKQLKETQQNFLDEMRYYQELTVETYRTVIDKYPSSKRIDEVRYFLGYHLTLMQRFDEAAAAYTELILKNPDSIFVPDALVNVAENFFSQNDFVNALKLYERAETYSDAPIYPFAIYKQGWCHYNLGNYDISMDKLITVIKLAHEAKKTGNKAVIGLAKEAANDLVLPYAKTGKVKGAMKFFKKWGGDRYLELTGKLATLYGEETDFTKSNALLRQLIKEARTARPGGKDMRYMTIRFQRQIVSNAEATGDKKLTVGEVQELIRLYLDLQGKAPKKFLDKESDGIDETILNLATSYHKEYKMTKKEETLTYTQLLYDEYLRVFSDRPNAYAITMNNALLMLMTGQFLEKAKKAEEALKKYEEAAAEFEKVIAMQPNGKFADEAGERAVIAYLKSMRVKTEELKKKKSESGDLAKKEMAGDALRFVQAVDRWMDILKRKGGGDQTDRQNIPKARFLSAYLYYQNNHFKEAGQRFADFVENHSGHEFSEDSALFVLDCYNKLKDKDNLLKYADLYENHPDLKGSTDLAEDIEKIRRELDFILCFDHEKKKKHNTAAACFLKYADEHPGEDGKAPMAIFNAAVNYFKAKKVEQAIKTQNRLYKSYSKSRNAKAREMAQKALYAIAEIFRETTVYEEAANVYEYFTKKHPKHELAKKALQLASVYRKTLGQYGPAVDNLELYLKRYPKEKNAPRIHLDIVLIRQLQGARARNLVQVAVNVHLKRFPKEPPGIRLRALNARGMAFQTAEKEDKATQIFQAMVDFYRKIPKEERNKLTMDERSAIAEAHFYLGKIVLAKAKRIKLQGKEGEVQKAIGKKLDLMNETKAAYNAVISYGHPGWTIAAYSQLGVAYRNLADAVENAPPPKRIRKDILAVEEYKTIMAEKAEAIRNKAVESYHTALNIAREMHWFNEYSEAAEEAISELDLTDTSVKEYRERPVHTGPNRGFPAFKQAEAKAE